MGIYFHAIIHSSPLIPRDLDLNLDVLPLDLHAKIQVGTFVRSAGIARWTDRQTDTHRCQNYYSHHVRHVRCNNNMSDPGHSTSTAWRAREAAVCLAGNN